MTWYIIGAGWFTLSAILGVLVGRFLERNSRRYQEPIVDRQRYTIEGDAPTPPPVR